MISQTPSTISNDGWDNIMNKCYKDLIDEGCNITNIPSYSLEIVNTDDESNTHDKNADRISFSLKEIPPLDSCNTITNQDILNHLSNIEEDNKKLTREMKSLRSRLKIAEQDIEEDHEHIFFLEKQLARLDQYGRRENIEISGIPSNVTDNNLEHEVLGILRQIGLKHIDTFHIVGCHRVGPADRNGCRNTIVRFLHRKDSIQCLKLRRNLNQCKYLGYNNLKIVENLCPFFRSIFDDLTTLKNEGQVNKVWTFNGIPNYKVTDDISEKPVKVFHEYELEKFYRCEMEG